MKNFQTIIIVIFIAAAIFGVLVFSGAIPIGGGGSGSLGTVVVWGTLPSSVVSAPLLDFNNNNPTLVVKYVQKSSDTFDQDLLEALALGKGPDLFFMPDDLAYQYSDKIFAIPYSSYPLATYKSTFSQAGDVFLTGKGILAFPMYVDPLMMYYNRSLFDASGIVYPPATWDDLSTMSTTLTKKDDTGKITQSAVALGHFLNIDHAKDILSALFMQAGNPIVKEKDGAFLSTLEDNTGPYNLSSILKFYTNFADPNQSLYSWNASFANSSDVFSKEELAIYFGFASELKNLINKNPNENFFVAPIPQIKNSNTKLTIARVTGLAISAATKNATAAFTAANLLSSGNFAQYLANAENVAPARRALLNVKPADAYSPYFYDSALFARSWLDPASKSTDAIFSGMINAVLSNNMTVDEAIRDASAKMSLLLNK